MPSTIARKSSSQNTKITIVTLRERASEMLRVADHLEATEKISGASRMGIGLRPGAQSSYARSRTQKTAATKKGPTVVAKAA